MANGATGNGLRRGAKSHISRSAMVLKKLRLTLLFVSLVIAAAVVFFAWSREDDLAAELKGMQFQEDPNVVRFSAHCGAPEDGTEGLLISDEPVSDIALHSAVVLSSIADTSADNSWPEDTGSPVYWDCEPQALPRYWRLNKHIDFKVVGSDGAKLERSFTPELLPSQEDGSDGYRCGAGQLTATGFRQAVGLGKHLSDAYGDLAGQAIAVDEFEVRSIDTKAALASTVGILMALLAAPRALHALGEGVSVPIKVEIAPSTEPNQVQKPVDVPSSGGLEKGRGAHLLARWCHQLPLPCTSHSAAAPKCISIQDAGATVRQDELELCPATNDASHSAGMSRFRLDVAEKLLNEIRRLLLRPAHSVTFLMTNSWILTALLQMLLGASVCSDPLLARPPMGSRLAVERWSKGDAFFWRVLWNGEDITHRLPGCDVDVDGLESRRGCDERAIDAFYKSRLWPSARS